MKRVADIVLMFPIVFTRIYFIFSYFSSLGKTQMNWIGYTNFTHIKKSAPYF